MAEPDTDDLLIPGSMPPRDALGSLEGGTFLEQVHAALIEVLSECEVLRKPGAVSVSIKITPQPHGRMASIVGHVNKVTPKRDPVGQYLFYKNGQLSKRDPDQDELPGVRIVEQPLVPPKEVTQPDAPAKEVN